jgi:hypothetical protein
MSSISCHPESSTLFRVGWCFKFERKVASETERDESAEIGCLSRELEPFESSKRTGAITRALKNGVDDFLGRLDFA